MRLKEFCNYIETTAQLNAPVTFYAPHSTIGSIVVEGAHGATVEAQTGGLLSKNVTITLTAVPGFAPLTAGNVLAALAELSAKKPKLVVRLVLRGASGVQMCAMNDPMWGQIELRAPNIFLCVNGGDITTFS